MEVILYDSLYHTFLLVNWIPTLICTQTFKNKLNLFLHWQYLWWHMNDSWEAILLRPFGLLASEEFYIIWLACYLAMIVSWWWFFHKSVAHNKLEIYIFTQHCVSIVMLQWKQNICWTMLICVLRYWDEYKIVQLSIFVLELSSVEH